MPPFPRHDDIYIVRSPLEKFNAPEKEELFNLLDVVNFFGTGLKVEKNPKLTIGNFSVEFNDQRGFTLKAPNSSISFIPKLGTEKFVFEINSYNQPLNSQENGGNAAILHDLVGALLTIDSKIDPNNLFGEIKSWNKSFHELQDVNEAIKARSAILNKLKIDRVSEGGDHLVKVKSVAPVSTRGFEAEV